MRNFINRITKPSLMKFFYLAAVCFISFFLIFPILKLIFESVSIIFNSEAPLPEGFFSYLMRVTVNTFTLAGISTAVSLLAAIPLSFLIVKFKVSKPGLWIALLTIPLITPGFISSFATIILFGKSGVVTMALKLLGINIGSIYGLRGLVITEVLHAVPYALIIIVGGLRTVPRYLEEAAQSMGASTFKTQTTIVLPYIMPHVVMAGLMVFLASIGDVGAPIIIGGSYKVISLEIYSNFVSFMGDERIPMIFSAWVILLSFILLFIVNKVMKVTNVKHKFKLGIMEYDNPRVRKTGTVVIALVTLMFLLPYAAIFIHSLGTIWSYSWLPDAFTLKNYQTVFADYKPVLNTLVMISAITPMIVFLGIILGYMFKNERTMKWFNYLTLLPFVLPGVVIGVSLLKSYSTVSFFGVDLVGSVVILIIAIGIRRLPFVLKTIEAGYAKIDFSQREAAFSLGATETKAFVNVIFPQIKASVYSAFVIGIVKVVTELSASLILYPPGWQNMSLYVAYYVEEGFISRAAAMAIFLILIVGTGTAISNYLSRKDALKYEKHNN